MENFIFWVVLHTDSYFYQLIFDKKQKGCVKRIHSITDDGLNERNVFGKV